MCDELTYVAVKERSTMVMCLNALIMNYKTSTNTINKLIKVIENEAIDNNRSDILETLELAGLICG